MGEPKGEGLHVLPEGSLGDFRDFANSLPQIVYSFLPAKEGLEFVNDRWLEYTGQSREDALGGFANDAIHPDDKERTLALWQRSLDEGVSYEDEIRIRGKNGEYRWFLTRSIFLKNAAGEILRWVGISTDINERKNSEEELRASRERTRLATEATGMVTWEWDVAKDRITLSESFASVYGLPALAGAAEGFALVFEEDKEAHLSKVQKTSKEGGSYLSQFRIRRPDTKKIVWLEERGTALLNLEGKVERLVGVTLDITERKRNEERLQQLFETVQEREQQLESAVKVGGLSPYEWNPQTGELTWDANLKAMWGLSPEASVNYETFIKGVHPEDRTYVEAQVAKAVDPNGDGSYEAEFRVMGLEDKQERWVTAKGQTFFDKERHPVHFVGIAQNITERKRSSERLRSAILRFSVAEEAVQGIGYEWELKGNVVTRTNIKGVLGYEPHELPDTWEAWAMVLQPQGASVTQEQARDFYRSVEGDSYSSEYQARHKDGRWLWMMDRGKVIRDGNGVVQRIIGLSINITERKEAELRDQQLQTVSVALGSALTPQEVYEVTLRETAAAIGANSGALYLLDGEVLKLAGGEGYDKGLLELYRTIPLSAPVPATKVVREGQAIWLRSRADFIAQFPHLEEHIHSLGSEAALSLPLVFEGQTLGVLNLTFPEVQPFDENQRRFLLTLAAMVAQALERSRLFEQVSERETRLRLALQNKAIVLAGVDRDLRYIWVQNPHPDFSEEGVIGKRDEDLLPEAAAKQFTSIKQKVLETGEAQRTEISVELSDGLHSYDFYAEPTRDAAGNTIGLTTSSFDISERKREEEARAWLAAMVNASQDAIISYNLEGKVLTWNPGAEKMFGYNSDEIVGQSMRLLVGEDKQDEFTSLLAKLGRGEYVTQLETVRVRKSGERFYALVTLSPVRSNGSGILGVAAVIQDISERKQSELDTQFLAALAEKIRLADDADDLLNTVCELTAKHFGVSQCGFAQVDLERGLCTIAHEFRTQDVRSLVGSYQMNDFTSAQDEVLRSGQMLVIEDTRSHPLTAPIYEKQQPLGLRAYLSQPVLRNGTWVGTMFVNSTSPRSWTKADIALLPTVAERTWLTLEKLQSERALRESEAKFRTLSEAAPALIWFDDAEGKGVSFNQQYLDFFGKTQEEVEGTGWHPLVHPDDAEAYIQDFLAAQRERRAFRHRARVQRHDGVWRWIESHAQPHVSADGTYLGHVGVSPDITESVEAEEALREADKRKDEFIAVLGHELRNPLAPIRTSIEIMKRTKDEEIQQEARDTIERQTSQMVHLIDDLLDVSRITQGRVVLKKERLPLAEIIGMAVESSNEIIADRKHTLNVSLPPERVFLEGDKTRLTQIVLNLLTNAAKYTPNGGTITLGAEVKGNEVVITVQDDGIGIPATMLGKVFDMFTRVERQYSYQQQGLGIGLSLVKQLVELHDGSISVSSEGEGKGSTFTVRLPALPVETKQESRRLPTATAPKASSRRVLVVDDYEPNLETLSSLLKLMGHEVATATNGEETLECLDTFKPEVVLLDINMPGMSGYEVATRIRAQPQYHPIMLVALTGYGQETDIERAKDAGFQHHLVKPVDVERLEHLLGNKG
jgi:PAS domain S-box-containing protein